MSDDERWIETVREEFRPEPMSPARAAAFRRALDERLNAAPPTRRFALPALAAAAGAALLLWLGWPATPPTSTPAEAAVASADVDAYSDPETFATNLADRREYLPADYQALALLLEDDAAER